MTEAYRAEVLAAMRTPESQITEVSSIIATGCGASGFASVAHKCGPPRRSIRGSIPGPRASGPGALRCIEPSIFSLMDARLERSPLIVAKWIRKN